MGTAKVRVFVVEDHPATAHGLKAFLELAGYEVDIATNCESALKLEKEINFDILLCDISLPDGTGWELIERMNQRQPVRGIAFSAYDEPEDVARSKTAGFAEHLVKGATPEELIAAIKRVAQQHL